MYKLNWKILPIVAGIDFIGNILFFPTKLRKLPEKPDKILVMRLDHIGDMILTTPVFKTLKMNYPQSEVHVLTRSVAKPILENNPYVDKIIEFNAPWFARGERTENLSRIVKRLRKEQYDLILELKGDPRNILLSYFIGGYRAGFGIRGFGFLLNRVIKWKGIKHITDRYLDVTKAVGCKKISTNLELFQDKKSKEKVDNLFKKHKIKENDFKICINPGVGAPERQWPLEYFSELINLILAKYKKAKVILVDVNPSKVDVVLHKVKDKRRVVNLSHNPDLNETIEIIRKSDLYIGLESASMHIASAVGTPLIDIHSGVTFKEEWGPYQGKNVILQRFVGLYASFQQASAAMRGIKPKMVLEAIKRLS